MHCNVGVSRSATLVIAYIMKYERKTFDESFEHVKSARPFISPNVGFVTKLLQLEKELEALQGITGGDLENDSERISG